MSTISETILKTYEELEEIEDYIQNIRNNLDEKSEEVSEEIVDNYTIDDAINTLEFIREYREITKELLKFLKNKRG